MTKNKENFVRADRALTDGEIELAVERLSPNWTRAGPRPRTGGKATFFRAWRTPLARGGLGDQTFAPSGLAICLKRRGRLTVSVKVPDRLTSMGDPAYRQPRDISCKVKLFSSFANIFETSSIRQYLSSSVLLRGLSRRAFASARVRGIKNNLRRVSVLPCCPAK